MNAPTVSKQFPYLCKKCDNTLQIEPRSGKLWDGQWVTCVDGNAHEAVVLTKVKGVKK